MALASGVGLLSIRPGWTDTSVDGQAPGAGTCDARPGPDGSTLPDPTCTPGTTDPSTLTVITAGVMSALASSDRNPPSSVRSAAQAVVFTAYGIAAGQQSSYVLDTLIPVALGGSWAYGNLWPVPVPHQFAPNKSLRDRKDVVAAYLHDAVVRHQVARATAGAPGGQPADRVREPRATEARSATAGLRGRDDGISPIRRSRHDRRPTHHGRLGRRAVLSACGANP